LSYLRRKCLGEECLAARKEFEETEAALDDVVGELERRREEFEDAQRNVDAETEVAREQQEVLDEYEKLLGEQKSHLDLIETLKDEIFALCPEKNWCSLQSARLPDVGCTPFVWCNNERFRLAELGQRLTRIEENALDEEEDYKVALEARDANVASHSQEDLIAYVEQLHAEQERVNRSLSVSLEAFENNLNCKAPEGVVRLSADNVLSWNLTGLQPDQKGFIAVHEGGICRESLIGERAQDEGSDPFEKVFWNTKDDGLRADEGQVDLSKLRGTIPFNPKVTRTVVVYTSDGEWQSCGSFVNVQSEELDSAENTTNAPKGPIPDVPLVAELQLISDLCLEASTIALRAEQEFAGGSALYFTNEAKALIAKLGTIASHQNLNVLGPNAFNRSQWKDVKLQALNFIEANCYHDACREAIQQLELEETNSHRQDHDHEQEERAANTMSTTCPGKSWCTSKSSRSIKGIQCSSKDVCNTRKYLLAENGRQLAALVQRMTDRNTEYKAALFAKANDRASDAQLAIIEDYKGLQHALEQEKSDMEQRLKELDADSSCVALSDSVSLSPENVLSWNLTALPPNEKGRIVIHRGRSCSQAYLGGQAALSGETPFKEVRWDTTDDGATFDADTFSLGSVNGSLTFNENFLRAVAIYNAGDSELLSCGILTQNET